MSRITFYGPKDVRAIEVRLFLCCCFFFFFVFFLFFVLFCFCFFCLFFFFFFVSRHSFFGALEKLCSLIVVLSGKHRFYFGILLGNDLSEIPIILF